MGNEMETVDKWKKIWWGGGVGEGVGDEVKLRYAVEMEFGMET